MYHSYHRYPVQTRAPYRPRVFFCLLARPLAHVLERETRTGWVGIRRHAGVTVSRCHGVTRINMHRPGWKGADPDRGRWINADILC